MPAATARSRPRAQATCWRHSALLAQGLDAKSALRYAVCIHGAAADAGRGGHRPLGVVASRLPGAAVNAAARARIATQVTQRRSGLSVAKPGVPGNGRNPGFRYAQPGYGSPGYGSL